MKTPTIHNRSRYKIPLLCALFLYLCPFVHTADAADAAELDWGQFKSTPVTLPDNTAHILAQGTADAIQELAMELNQRFYFITTNSIPTDLRAEDIYRAAVRLKYWTLYHEHTICKMVSVPGESPDTNFLATFFSQKMAPPKGNLTKKPDFMELPDPNDPHLIFTYLVGTLHDATGGWVPTEDLSTLIDVIGAMMSRADYNLGEVRVLAYWLRDTLTTLDPKAPEKGVEPNAFTFSGPVLDDDNDALFADDDDHGATAVSPHTPQVESDIFEAAKAFYRGPTPWKTQQKVMHVLHRIAFAITTPNFEDAQLAETLKTPPLNAVPNLTLPSTMRAYGPFLEKVLIHFSKDTDTSGTDDDSPAS